MSENPRVSVVMSVHNGARFVAESIDSVLAQDFSDFEFIIINDGSTDDSRDIVLSRNDARIRLVDNPACLGLTRSLNRGLEMARGALVARQDDDDIWRPDRLSRQISYMEAHPDVAVVGSQVLFINEHGRPLHIPGWEKPLSNLGLQWQVMFDSPFTHSSVIFRRDIVWGELGGYNEQFQKSQDYELWSRVIPRFPVANLPEQLCRHRLHATSVSKTYNTQNVERVSEAMAANMRVYLHDDALARRWATLWSRLLNAQTLGPPSGAGEIGIAVDRLFDAFCRVNPQAASHREIRTHMASVLARSACAIATEQRRAGAGLYLKTLRVDLKMAGAFASRFAYRSVVPMRPRAVRPASAPSGVK